MERDLLLIYDAAMEDILFDGRAPVSPLEHEGMAERTVIIGSMSKMWRMIGWRVGWIAGPASVVADAGWVHTYNTTGNVSVSRRAAEAVLRGPQEHVAAATRSWSGAATRSSRRCRAGRWCGRAAGGRCCLEIGADTDLLPRGVAATGMRGWGASVASRYVRFVFSAEPVSRLATLGARLGSP